VSDNILGVIVYKGSSFSTGGDNPGSTDPTDIAYDPVTGGYYLVDSEVDESPFYSKVNMFRLDGQGDLQAGINLTAFTKEPTGVAVWVSSSGEQRLFITDDNTGRVFEVDAENPTVALRSFSTTTFGCVDPEDISIDPRTGNLFILSENDRRIYEVTQTGALISVIELPSYFKPIQDPNAADSGAEALAYDAERDVFYVAGGWSTDIYVVNRAGQVIDTIDVLANYPNANGLRVYAKGMELGPSSTDPTKLSLWITDYGLDQKADGRVIEIRLDRPAPTVEPNEVLTGTANNDMLKASSSENWTLDGLAGNDTITTLGGNDFITGGAGNDTVSAGDGDDLILFTGTGGGFDSVNGGAGYDTIVGGTKSTKIGLTSVSGIEEITSNGLALVTIVGSSAADTLDFTNVKLTGIASINGGGGNDTIYGSAGADMIVGAAGADTLRGNGGADRFDYNNVADSRASARDRILDFQPGTDKLDLLGVDANSGASGNQAFSFIGTTAFSNKAGELRIDTSDPSKTVVLGDTNGDGVADFAIELSGNLQLSAGDFIL
jgi:Ca2+-binding RTX toxin-like protein